MTNRIKNDTWEVRTNPADHICRVFFTVIAGFMILLHGIIKKDRKTPFLGQAKRERNGLVQ
ncbi:MAG: type II toxin-antitoxin system RelE/ParE family toxin [Treponema sp.]|nr:type II toxin-antitoxin system RelE/ParE family toxin [Treponema sp.]